MHQPEWATAVWTFGAWQIEPAINCIKKADQLLQIEPRLMTALMVLINAEGRIVSDAELMRAVWPKVIVSDASLYQVIAQLRKVLADQKKPFQLIERVHKKGYRLLQPATKIATTADNAIADTGNNTLISPEKRRSPLLLTLCSLILVLTAGSFWFFTSEQFAGAEHAVSANSDRPLMDNNDWLQQASYLINQPNAEAVKRGISYLEQQPQPEQQSAAYLVTLCNGYHAMHTYSDWPIDKVIARCEPLLQRALAQQADFAPALASFGAIQLSRGNEQAAQYYLEKAITLAPDDVRIMLWRADLYRVQGDFAQALSLLTAAQQLAPLSGLAKRYYAYTLLDNGRFRLARDQFKHALLIDSHYSDRPLDELEFLPLTTQRAVDFLSWAQRYPDRLNRPERLVHLSLVKLSLGQTEQAQSTLQAAIKATPDNLFVLLAQAMLAHAQGHTGQAQFYLQQRAKLAPAHKLIQLQALLLVKDDRTTLQKDVIQQWLPDYFVAPEAAAKRDLDSNQPLNLLYFLLSLSEQERRKYQSLVIQFVSEQQQADSICLQLLSAVGQTAQAEQLALVMLDQGWLPSAHDDFYLAENHPLWRSFSVKFFQKLRLKREEVIEHLKQSSSG